MPKHRAHQAPTCAVTQPGVDRRPARTEWTQSENRRREAEHRGRHAEDADRPEARQLADRRDPNRGHGQEADRGRESREGDRPSHRIDRSSQLIAAQPASCRGEQVHGVGTAERE